MAFDLNGQRAGLEIRAVDADNVEIALSMPIYDLGEERRVVVNLVAPADIVAVGPEFSRMSADISSHVGGDPANIKLAREDHERSDLTTLHEVTGWDARLIALAAKTHQLADESRLSPKVLYGLARAGLPTDRQLLARIPQESVDVALTKSQNAGIVSLDAAERASFNADFATFASSTRRESIAAGTRSSIGELLNQSALTDAEKTTFENLHFVHGGRGEEFWKNVRDAGIGEPKIAGLRLQGKLAYLTRNNAPLTAILQNELGSHMHFPSRSIHF